MKKKAIIISCVVLVVLLLGGLTVLLLGNGNKGTVADKNNTETVGGTESELNTESTEDVVVDAGSEMDTIEGSNEEVVEGGAGNVVTEETTNTNTNTNTNSNTNVGSKPVTNTNTESKPQTKPQSGGSNKPNKDVVADSSNKDTVVKEETKEYSAQELAAIKSGYRKVTYVPEKNMYVVLMPDGEPGTFFEALALIDEFLGKMGYESVPSSCRGGWINPEANQYLVQCAEVRVRSTSKDESIPPKDEYDMLNGEGAWDRDFGGN